MKVTVVGSWHLGSVIGACLAEAGNSVSLWDQNPAIAKTWVEGRPPIHEPGLEELASKHWGKNLFWCDALQKSVPEADWVVISYDTPVSQTDELLIDVVDEGFNAVLDAGFKNSCYFFVTAQVPVGTTRRFRAAILKRNPDWKGHIFYQPENLRLGEALKSFQGPDRAVLGLDAEDLGLASSFQELTRNTQTPLNLMSLESAEMTKHALNSFLATCVVFANELSEICEKNGANSWDVVASLKQDSRVGPKAFLRPGLGFAGGTLARDVKALKKLSGKPQALNFFDQLYEVNKHRNDWVIKSLQENLGDLKGKKIVLLGLTYKPFTSTVRRSPSFEIAELLWEKGATCVSLDPMADLQELTPSERSGLKVTPAVSADEAFRGASGAVLMTEWPQFKELDWKKLAAAMMSLVLVDCKKLFEKKDLPQNMTIVVPGIPRPSLS